MTLRGRRYRRPGTVKPENVLLTGTGVAIGTPAYNGAGTGDARVGGAYPRSEVEQSCHFGDSI